MIDAALIALVVVMMVAVGLALRPEALSALRTQRKHLLIGLVGNLALVPALAAAIAAAVDLPAGVASALVLCAAAPGGPAGATFARIAHADLAFATALQVALVLGAVAGTPLWIAATTGAPTAEVRDLAALLAAVQLVPLVAAMAVRARAPALADRLAGPAARVANLTLLGVVAALVALRVEVLGTFPLSAHAALALPLAGVLALGLRDPSPAGALPAAAALVTAVRNMSVALLVARSAVGDPPTEAAVLVAGFWMMVLPGGAAWLRGRSAGTAPAEG